MSWVMRFDPRDVVELEVVLLQPSYDNMCIWAEPKCSYAVAVRLYISIPPWMMAVEVTN